MTGKNKETKQTHDSATTKEGTIRRRRRVMTPHSAEEKCRAVLAVWSERRKQSDVCREWNIPWAILSKWEERALSGMLNALMPRVRLQEQGPSLSPRLDAMLTKRQNSGPLQRLTRLQARELQTASAAQKDPV